MNFGMKCIHLGIERRMMSRHIVASTECGIKSSAMNPPIVKVQEDIGDKMVLKKTT